MVLWMWSQSIEQRRVTPSLEPLAVLLSMKLSLFSSVCHESDLLTHIQLLNFSAELFLGSRCQAEVILSHVQDFYLFIFAAGLLMLSVYKFLVGIFPSHKVCLNSSPDLQAIVHSTEVSMIDE